MVDEVCGCTTLAVGDKVPAEIEWRVRMNGREKLRLKGQDAGGMGWNCWKSHILFFGFGSCGCRRSDVEETPSPFPPPNPILRSQPPPGTSNHSLLYRLWPHRDDWNVSPVTASYCSQRRIMKPIRATMPTTYHFLSWLIPRLITIFSTLFQTPISSHLWYWRIHHFPMGHQTLPSSPSPHLLNAYLNLSPQTIRRFWWSLSLHPHNFLQLALAFDPKHTGSQSENDQLLVQLVQIVRRLESGFLPSPEILPYHGFNASPCS